MNFFYYFYYYYTEFFGRGDEGWSAQESDEGLTQPHKVYDADILSTGGPSLHMLNIIRRLPED